MSGSAALDVGQAQSDEEKEEFYAPASSSAIPAHLSPSTAVHVLASTSSSSSTTSRSHKKKQKQKQKTSKQWQIDPLMMQQAFDVLKTNASAQIIAPPPPSASRSVSPGGRIRERTDSQLSKRGSDSSPISDSDKEKSEANLIAPPLPTVLPKIISNLSEQLFLPIRSFTDICHCWPRLTSQVSQGLGACVSFGEYLLEVGPEVSAIGPASPPLDAMANYAKAVTNAMTSEHSERVQAYQLRRALAEQVGKPLLKHVIEARSQFLALVSEEQRATKTMETLLNHVSDQKVKCMIIWEEFKSWDGKGKGPQSAVPSSVAAVLRKYSTAPPVGKSTLDQACKDFHCYETLLKRLNGDQVRYIRDMDRLLLALETIEKGRLQALYSALQTYNVLKQQVVTLPSPSEQLAQYFASFDPADFRRLRFSAVAYDLPCSPEDFKEGTLISSPETITRVSAEVALGSFDLVTPVTAIRVAPPPPPFSKASGALPPSALTTSAILIPPSSKFIAASAANTPPPLPSTSPDMNEDEKRTHVARLLSAELDLELPKLHSEESDQTGSGYLELMANSLNTSTLASTWKTLYCSVRSAKLMISTRKGETSLFASYYLRAARFTRYGPLDVKGRPHCFSIYFPHSNQRVVFAAKTELGVTDWLQALTRTAVSSPGVLGRAVIMPALALAENTEGVMKRLDTIEKSLAWFREYAVSNAAQTNASPPNRALSDDSGDDGDVESSPRIHRGTHGNLWKESQLSTAIKLAYSKAEMSGYLDRLLVGWIEHEPYLGMGSHCHWDLMASVNRKYWLILKIFLLGGPNVLKVVKPSMTKNIDRLAKVILNIANFVGTASELMDTFIHHEVANTPRETQLFRTDSLTTKMWAYFSALEGKSYVYKLLSKPVHACFLDASEGCVSFELDSTKIDTTVHEKKQITPLAHSRSSSGSGWWFGGKKSNDDDPQGAGLVRRRSSVNTPNHGDANNAEDRPRRASSPSVPPTATASTPATSTLATPVTSPPLPPLFLAGRLADVERAWFLSHRNYPEPEIKIAPRSEEAPAPKDSLKVKPLTHSGTQQDGMRQVLSTNQANLEQALQLFLNEIIRSLEYCPRALRVAAHSVQRAVGEAFPSAKWSAVGGFFFLRFLVPQILMVPWAAETASNPQARRNLVVMTKVLQILANSANADGGSREQIMGLLAAKESSIQTMVGFVLQNVERLTKFLIDLANPPDPRFFQNLVEPSAQMLEEQAKELEPDLEWFFVNILSLLDVQTET